jgi:hypothetical protein
MTELYADTVCSVEDGSMHLKDCIERNCSNCEVGDSAEMKETLHSVFSLKLEVDSAIVVSATLPIRP